VITVQLLRAVLPSGHGGREADPPGRSGIPAVSAGAHAEIGLLSTVCPGIGLPAELGVSSSFFAISEAGLAFTFDWSGPTTFVEVRTCGLSQRKWSFATVMRRTFSPRSQPLRPDEAVLTSPPSQMIWLTSDAGFAFTFDWSGPTTLVEFLTCGASARRIDVVEDAGCLVSAPAAAGFTPAVAIAIAIGIVRA
jgi:hypothetical protein